MSQRGNKNAQKWGKGISRGVGAAIGGIAGGGNPQAIALGAQVGGLLDPLYDYMYPVYHENHLIKKNIGSGTMSDNYQYGKTEDSFSMDFMSKDPMEKFNKILGHVDTGIQLGGMIGGDLSGLAKKNFTEGTKAASSILTGGTKAASSILTGGSGGVSPMQTGKGILNIDNRDVFNTTKSSMSNIINSGVLNQGIGDLTPMQTKPLAQIPSILTGDEPIEYEEDYYNRDQLPSYGGAVEDVYTFSLRPSSRRGRRMSPYSKKKYRKRYDEQVSSF